MGQELGGTENLSSGGKEFLLRSIVLGCTHRTFSGLAGVFVVPGLAGPRVGLGREGGRASCSGHSQLAGTEVQAWAILALGTVSVKVIEHSFCSPGSLPSPDIRSWPRLTWQTPANDSGAPEQLTPWCLWSPEVSLTVRLCCLL